VKDRLESLRRRSSIEARLICRRAATSPWLDAAYKKYFHTDRPVIVQAPPVGRSGAFVAPAPTPITQNADIRYLGKLLGDVIRAYGGDALFERIEHIRAASVDRFRGIAGAAAVDRGLEALSLDETLAFVRGFMLFSMLANLAEDRQGAERQAGDDVAEALKRLASEGVDRARAASLLDAALIVPVLTAHPTEVMRKSMLDHRNRIAELMRLRDLGRVETRDGDVIEQAILRQIALLWQTRPLRRERLFVADEVEIALAYFRDMLLPVLPALYARWERDLSHRPRSFLRLGSWIGGDRDGNPNVNADSLRLALKRASQTVIASYLDRLHALGADLSISTELASPTEAVAQLADRSGDLNAARRDEPYRRAITGMYARLAATYERLTGESAPRPPSVAGERQRQRRGIPPPTRGHRALARRPARGCLRPAARWVD
jgi:phosphoenolpyruvate carboxylase